MSILDNRDDYKKNPYFKPEDVIYSDYTAFYVVISICSILAGFLIILNIAFCYCSQYRNYWKDRHTGNFIFFYKHILDFIEFFKSDKKIFKPRQSLDKLDLDFDSSKQSTFRFDRARGCDSKKLLHRHTNSTISRRRSCSWIQTAVTIYGIAKTRE